MADDEASFQGAERSSLHVGCSSYSSIDKFASLDNTKLLEMIKYRTNYLSKVVKKAYKNPIYLEPFMLESNSQTLLPDSDSILVLSSIDSDVEELSLTAWTMKFKDATRETRFQIYNTTQSLKFSKAVYYITFVLFVAYAIVNAAIEREITYGYSKLIIIIIGIGLLILISSRNYKKYFNFVNIMVACICTSSKLHSSGHYCSCSCQAGLRLS